MSEFSKKFDILPVFTERKGGKLYLNYEGFSYCLEVVQGQIITAGADGVCVQTGKSSLWVEILVYFLATVK